MLCFVLKFVLFDFTPWRVGLPASGAAPPAPAPPPRHWRWRPSTARCASRPRCASSPAFHPSAHCQTPFRPAVTERRSRNTIPSAAAMQRRNPWIKRRASSSTHRALMVNARPSCFPCLCHYGIRLAFPRLRLVHNSTGGNSHAENCSNRRRACRGGIGVAARTCIQHR